jgi:hypothetical protein
MRRGHCRRHGPALGAAHKALAEANRGKLNLGRLEPAADRSFTAGCSN